MDKTLKFSAIIVTWNSAACIEGCLDSLQQAGGEGFDVIVVDNNSRDDTVSIVEKRPGKNLTLIKSNKNLGYGAACNLGAESAKSGLFFFFNPDIVIHRDYFVTVVKAMDNNPGIQVAGGQVVFPNGEPQDSFFDFPGLQNLLGKYFRLPSFLPEWPAFRGFQTVRTLTSTASCDRVLGANLVVQKSAFERVKGFDETFFLYGEEVDLCFRAKKAGLGIFGIPQARIIHNEQESSGQVLDQALVLMVRGDYLFAKHHKPWVLPFLIPAILVSMVLKTVLGAMVYLFVQKKKTRNLAKNKLKAYVRVMAFQYLK